MDGFCDILMVGGGGAGGTGNSYAYAGGGGGGGAVLYGSNIYIPHGNYNIKVGDGAIPGESTGKSTTGFGATILGGGSAFSFYGGNSYMNPYITNANNGGSGAGGMTLYSTNSYISFNEPIYDNVRRGGTSNLSSIGILTGATLYNGEDGGPCLDIKIKSGSGSMQSGGGGGAGTKGGPGTSSAGLITGNGGTGVLVNITGVDLYWGGGGGGGSFELESTNGGLGGGGAGEKGLSFVYDSTINRYNYNTKGYGTVGGSSYTTPVKMNAGSGTGGGGGGAVQYSTNISYLNEQGISSIKKVSK
jgi:hypothetical protein